MHFQTIFISKKQWTLPDGTMAVNPKEEGMGIMYSSFCSRDFGYGFKLSEEQLVIVNWYREGKDYVDEEAAMEVLKTKRKQALKHSPFIQRFDYCINADGYLDYKNMILQFEDVVDVIKALYEDRFDFLFFLPQCRTQ